MNAHHSRTPAAARCPLRLLRPSPFPHDPTALSKAPNRPQEREPAEESEGAGGLISASAKTHGRFGAPGQIQKGARLYATSGCVGRVAGTSCPAGGACARCVPGKEHQRPAARRAYNAPDLVSRKEGCLVTVPLVRHSSALYHLAVELYVRHRLGDDGRCLRCGAWPCLLHGNAAEVIAAAGVDPVLYDRPPRRPAATYWAHEPTRPLPVSRGARDAA